MRLIDADALKEKIVDNSYLITYDYEFKSVESGMSLTGIQQAIDEMPTVEPNRWIPCSERLPDYGKPVLISALMPLCVMVYIGYLSDDVWFCDRLFFRSDEVVAWMPLPNPYERDEQ